MKTYFSQRTKGYEKIKLGNGPGDLYNYGCFVVSLANLSGIDPVEVNEILKKGGHFQRDLIISSAEMAKLLGLEYYGRDNLVTKNPEYRTIAEVDMSPSPGKQQHFVVVKEDGSIIDPWTGTIRPKGTYPLISYRLFRKLQNEPETNETPEVVQLPEGDLIEAVAKAIRAKEGWYLPSPERPEGSVSWRCKNPGNILWGDLAKSLGAVSGYTSSLGLTYAVFETETMGFHALKVFLMLGFSGQLKHYEPEMTLKEFFKIYSGGGETYGQFVSDKTGIPVSTKVKYIYDKYWDNNH